METRFPYTTVNTPSNPPPPTPALQISEDDVRQVFQKQKRWKAPGQDRVTPACLKTCADQLAHIFSQIFNRSLELCEVPACFKCSTIIQLLKNITGPLLDPLQFTYKANRSMDDAGNMGLHLILQHLDKTGTYPRILFVDFSSAFNTIISTLWLDHQLSEQLVRIGKFTSCSRTISTGAPHGCVAHLLTLVKLLKFADDTTHIGLIQDSDESAYRQVGERLTVWCSLNNLELNTLKTLEMIVNFRRNPPTLPHSPSWTVI